MARRALDMRLGELANRLQENHSQRPESSRGKALDRAVHDVSMASSRVLDELELMRVCVTGSQKSGRSTLVQALLGIPVRFDDLNSWAPPVRFSYAPGSFVARGGPAKARCERCGLGTRS
jgi:hypothetical protein